MKHVLISFVVLASTLVWSTGCKNPFSEKVYTIKITDAYTNQTIQGASVTLYKYDSSEPNAQPAEFANATSNSSGEVTFTIDFGNRGEDDGFLYRISVLNYVDVATFDADLCGSAGTGFVKSRGKELDLANTTTQTASLYPIAHVSIVVNPTTLTGNPARILVKCPAPDCFNKNNLNYDNPNFWFDASPYTTGQSIGPLKAIANKPIQLQLTAYDSTSAVMMTKTVDARTFLPGDQTITLDF